MIPEDRQCIEFGCLREAASQGFCRPHYYQLWRDGELPIEEVREKPPLMKWTGMMMSDGEGNYSCVDCGAPGEPFEICICSKEEKVGQ